MNEYPKKRYGAWAGSKGNSYDNNRCAEEVASGWHHFQCSRKNGHGDRNLFCKQHAKRHPKKAE